MVIPHQFFMSFLTVRSNESYLALVIGLPGFGIGTPGCSVVTSKYVGTRKALVPFIGVMTEELLLDLIIRVMFTIGETKTRD